MLDVFQVLLDVTVALTDFGDPDTQRIDRVVVNGEVVAKVCNRLRDTSARHRRVYAGHRRCRRCIGRRNFSGLQYESECFYPGWRC